jgi:predicted GNAT superfamily acetyltransferase
MFVRALTSLEDLRSVVALEKDVWQYDGYEDVVSLPVLLAASKRGGILLGAFDTAGAMVGFVYSFPSVRDGVPAQWSHALAVVRSCRQAGIGRLLKLEQRRKALEMGIGIVEWTFDPLQVTNAHFNFRRLGVVAHEYEIDFYGESPSALHKGTATDRLIVEWAIASSRVEQRISESHAAERVESLPVANLTRDRGGWAECIELDTSIAEPRLCISVPADFHGMQSDDPTLAMGWRFATRTLFLEYLSRGYWATDFTLDRSANLGRYLLERTR